MYAMAEASNLQIETTVQMNDMEDPCMDYGPSTGTRNSSGELASEQTKAAVVEALELGCLIEDDDNDSASGSYKSCYSGHGTHTVPHVPDNFTNEIEEFMPGVRRYFKTVLGRRVPPINEEEHRQLFSAWNTFLQPVQGIRGTAAIISSNIKDDINKFISRQEEQQGVQLNLIDKKWIKGWLPEWNMFLRARTGETLVTRWNLCLTIVGFLFYLVDLVSDIGTSVYYASNGQWWRAIVTLAVVYGAVIIHSVVKWTDGQIDCTGAADWLRYVASLLVNWPDLQQYGAFCLLEWHLHKSPVKNACLIPDWHVWRARVAFLKYSEGVWEACPQAILQLCLLVPDLYGAWTWTDYLRIAGACVSLCTAGAALVNFEKGERINNYNDMPLSELVVLHVWAVPVTVSRLLSVALLLSVHLYWALAGVALHLVLRGVYWCNTEGVPHEMEDVIDTCLDTLQFCISPFLVDESVTNRRVLHAVHLLVNTAVTVVWALGTPLACAHPALYAVIICFNAVMFAVGLVGMELYGMYWLGSFQ